MSLVIDFEHHYIPDDLAEAATAEAEAIARGAPPSREQRRFFGDQSGPQAIRGLINRRNLEEHIAHMDEAGIDVAVVAAVGVGWEANLEGCKFVNERMAETLSKHAKRFIPIAHIAAMEGDRAVREVRRAVEELGFRAVAIPIFVDGHNLDARELWPFYEAVSALKVPLYIHPLISPSLYGPVPKTEGFLHRSMVREFDIMTAVVKLITSGALRDFPELTPVFCHFGGGISVLRERIQRWEHTAELPQRFSEGFRKLYFTIGGLEVATVALQAALLGIGADRLMFGTDYPHDFRGGGPQLRQWVQHIQGLAISGAEKEMILGGNAAKLLGL